ncbi:MAG: PAS domain S-box protein [Nitrospirae bacterium]|nr:PAS domain S-box protein [Nitrospirota bacterium]
MKRFLSPLFQAVVAMTAIVFILDLFTSLGVAVWLFYLLPLLLGNRADQRLNPFALAAVFTGLAVLGFFLSPSGVSIKLAILNRVMGVAVFWIVALLLARRSAADDTQRQSEARMRSVFEQANDGIYVIAAENRYLDANDRGLELLGYTREELLQMSVADVLAPYEVARLAVEPPRMMSGVPHLAEWDHIRKDGSTFPGEVSARRLNDLSYLAIVRDLTERRRVEETLAASEKRFRELLENVQLIALLLDVNGKVIFCNEYLLNLTGYTREETNGSDWFDRMIPGALPEVKELFLRGLKSGEITPHFENPISTKKGELRHIAWNNTILRDAEGHVSGTASIGEDITERKRAEEAMRESEARMKLVMDGLGPQMFVGLMDTEGVVLMANRPAMEVAGLRPEDVYGKPCPETYWFAYSDTVRQRLRAAIQRAAHGEAVRYDEQIRAAEGQLAWIDFSLQPLRDESGKIVFLIPSANVITERKKAEEELNKYREHLEELVKNRTVELKDSRTALISIVEDLNQKSEELMVANERLKEVDRLKSMFIASMSHELRTPLNSVIGFSSIILNQWKGPVNEDQKLMLSIVLRSGKHLLALINDVIDVSKIEAGMVEVHVEEFFLDEVITEAVELMKKEATDKGLALEVEAIHLQMKTDRRRLLQSVLNLLSNAVKFTPEGSVKLRAQAGIDFENKKYAEIEVEDTGIGIKEEDMPKLFQAFSRLDSPLRATVPGTGLGLYLTRKLVTEVLKGDIIAAGEIGKGSRFSIQIPLTAEFGIRSAGL